MLKAEDESKISSYFYSGSQCGVGALRIRF